MACCSIGCAGLMKAVVGGCVIAFVGIAIGGVHSWLHPVSLRLDETKITPTIISPPPTPPQPSPTNSQPVVTPPAPTAAPATDPPAAVTLGLEITSDQAKLLYDMGAPFIDAREPQFFAEGHVDRAMNFTADQIIPNAGDLIRWRPGPIVVYCSGGDCDASHHVANRLQDLKFTQIHIMVDGFPAWKEKGFPVVVGK
jgi:rhodanese-related sulfurtransferase